MSTQLQPVYDAAGANAIVNQNFQAVSPAGVYGMNAFGSSGLGWAYYGGRAFGNEVVPGVVTLAPSVENYIVAERATGAVTAATTTTNWNNTAGFMRLYSVLTSSDSVFSWSDYREAYGAAATGGGGGSASWGAIGGDLSDQIDLSDALDAKQNRGPALQSVTSAGTVTPTFSDDMVKVTAQAAALTLANPSGTAVDGYGGVIRIKDSGTGRAITFGSNYRAVGVTLPSTTVAGKTLYLAWIWNSDDTKADIVAVGQEA